MTSIEWKGEHVFEATLPSGNKFVMDSTEDHGGHNAGPTPLEAFVAAAAACSAMDVIDILHKKRLDVRSYRVEVDGERTEEGKYPRPYVSLIIRHIVEGDNIDEAALARSVQLSDEKYCSAIATLRAAPTVTSAFELVKPSL
jgi:putative redox protein